MVGWRKMLRVGTHKPAGLPAPTKLLPFPANVCLPASCTATNASSSFSCHRTMISYAIYCSVNARGDKCNSTRPGVLYHREPRRQDEDEQTENLRSLRCFVVHASFAQLQPDLILAKQSRGQMNCAGLCLQIIQCREMSRRLPSGGTTLLFAART
jgi:hypothetical protein